MFSSRPTIGTLRSKQEGASLVEILVAVAVGAVGFTSLAAVSSQCIRQLAVQAETTAASQLVEERLEKARSSSWSTLTDAASLRDTVLGSSSAQEARLHNYYETITVSPYPSVSPSPTPLVVSRASDGTLSIVSQPSGFPLPICSALRVDAHVNWASLQNGLPRVREISTVIALGGILQ